MSTLEKDHTQIFNQGENLFFVLKIINKETKFDFKPVEEEDIVLDVC